MAILLIDAASSIVFRTDREATISQVSSVSGPPTKTIVIFPGYGMSGALAAESLSGVVEDDTTVIGVSYAERGVDVDAIADEVKKHLAPQPSTDIYFYGASMGGLVANKVAESYLATEDTATITLVLDTAPTTAKDVRRPRYLLELSCWYPGGVLSSAAWWLAAKAAAPVPARGASPELIAKGRDYGQSLGTPALTSQACFIHHAEIETRSEVARLRIYYATAPDADLHDPLIDTEQARVNWQSIYTTMTAIEIAARQAKWHVPLVERPLDVWDVIDKIHRPEKIIAVPRKHPSRAF